MVEFHKILGLFNTQHNRPRASPAIFKHVGQVPYSRASNLGKRGRSKFCKIFAYRSGVVEFHQILRLFNTQPNRPKASPAIFKHVGQVPYSRGFKFGEKGPIKMLYHLPTGPGWLNLIKFYIFSTHSLIGLGPRLEFLSM